MNYCGAPDAGGHRLQAVVRSFRPFVRPNLKAYLQARRLCRDGLDDA